MWKSRVIGKTNENPSVQRNCQVCVAIPSGNMVIEQDHTEMDPDFCKPVLADNIGNTVDGQSQQQIPLGENQPSSNRDRNS